MANKLKLAGIVGIVAAGVISTQLPLMEGNKYKPYYDGANVLTVCMGVTHPKPIPGKIYTKEECDALNEMVVAQHAEASVAYLPKDAKPGYKILAVLAGYNLGSRRIKDSRLPEMISNNDPKACDALVKYHFVAGKDCSIRSNNCWGVYQRRLTEAKLCKEYNQE